MKGRALPVDAIARKRCSFVAVAACLATVPAVAEERSDPPAGSAPVPNTREGSARTVGFLWEGPAGIHDCMTPETLRERVESDIGHPLFRDPPADVTLRVRVERTGSGGFRAVLAIESSDGRTWGQRELSADGPSCAALDGPLTLAATLLVDEDMLSPPPKEEPKPEPPPPPEPPRLVIVNPPQPPPDRHRTRWRFDVDASLVGAAGVAPGISAGGDVAFEVGPSGWPSLRLHGTELLPKERSADGGAAIRFSILYAGISVCPDLVGSSRVTAGLCVGADLVHVAAASHGVREPRKSSRSSFQGSLAGRVTLRLGKPWFLRATAALFPLLSRDEYVVTRPDGSDELVYQRSAVSGVLAVGAGAEFGGPD